MSPNTYNDNFEDFDKFDAYAEQFDPLNYDRQARRKRKPKAKHKAKKAKVDILQEVADATGIEGGFRTTYQPARYEAEWLYQSLQAFYYEDIISDVLAMLKGGKEASVYRCQAHPSTGLDFIAAKVYRPRRFRNLRNDAMYREGRQTLTGDGKAVKGNDHRTMRAIGKNTAFGNQVKHTSWLMHEYNTLNALYQAGGAVPKPYSVNDNAILMSYHGDAHQAAPTLNEVQLDPEEAQPLFEQVMDNIELMLQHRLIHGDLSAYNILYWQGEIILIDFPQVVNFTSNKRAPEILERDVTRVCQYFAQQGVDCDPEALLEDFWERHLAPDPESLAADLSLSELEDVDFDDE